MPTRTLLPVLLLAVALLFQPAAAQAVTPRPPAAQPAGDAWSFGIQFPPGAPVTELEWELEAEFATRDFRAVFAHYDALLGGLGFERTSLDDDSDEVEAEYRLGGLEAELEVELEGDRTEVELEIEGRARRGSGLFTDTGGLNVPLYPAALLKLEWEVELLHDTGDHRSVFAWYDDGLRAEGWERTGLDRSSGETEARYVLGDLRLELEVEREDGFVEVEFELRL